VERSCFDLFFSAGVLTPNLALARQALYHLSPSTSPFLGFFEVGTISQGLQLQTLNLLISAS
jgi:hypothetical protein